MKLGFVADYSPDTVAFAGRAGFDCLEMDCDPRGPLNLRALTADAQKRVMDDFAQAGVSVGTLGVGLRHLHADPAQRADKTAYFIEAIKRCRSFGTDIVMTNAYCDEALKPADNMKLFAEVFGEYARVADGEGVRIAMENCPHWNGYPRTIGNLAFSPEMWDAMFDAVPSRALGLEFDPSHMVWMGMRYVKLLRAYGDRVYAFHAKDTEILEDERDRYGFIGKQISQQNDWDWGWYRYRIPGWGCVDWKAVFCALNDIGFDGPLVIEHEDPVFGGERTREGLTLGLRYLKQFIA